LSKPSDATYSARPVGQPGFSRRFPQPGQLTIGEELLGYHNNNNNQKSFCVILEEFIICALVKLEVARAPNQQSISGLVEKVLRYV